MLDKKILHDGLKQESQKLSGFTVPEISKPQAKFDEEWWNNLAGFTPDFCPERKQPELPNREDIFL